ncbi:NUDIX domain-containing protein [Candidatus Roizmanbacteria bacterium]|nr:NUDIX domain-containing protein [Candidatus Roizmanbacteria bacterium]
MKPGIDYIGTTTPFYCIDGKGNLLLHKRSPACRDEHGRWDPGGGQVEFGEALEQSALREVKEEYGCEGKIVGTLPAHSVLREHNGVKTHWVACPFFVLVDPQQVKVMEPEKVEDIGWFTLNSLPSPLHSGFEKTLLSYRKHFEKYV